MSQLFYFSINFDYVLVLVISIAPSHHHFAKLRIVF